MARAFRFDVAGLGEVMLRLSVPAGERLDDARRLDVEYGGAECNTCVALARLGRRAAWVGRLPDHALGNAVLRAVRADGVDVSAVKRAPGERIGTYFIEYAGAPRAIQVIYDRADSAAARMTVGDVDWDYLLEARVLHISGITAGLSDSCHAVVAEAMRRARAAGVTVSFDVNYRAKLWSAAAAGEQAPAAHRRSRPALLQGRRRRRPVRLHRRAAGATLRAAGADPRAGHLRHLRRAGRGAAAGARFRPATRPRRPD